MKVRLAMTESTALVDRVFPNTVDYRSVIFHDECGTSVMDPLQQMGAVLELDGISVSQWPKYGQRVRFSTSYHFDLGDVEVTSWISQRGGRPVLPFTALHRAQTQERPLPTNWTDLLVGTAPVATGTSQEQLADLLRQSFEAVAVEDGMIHPAEQIISEALRSVDDDQLLSWIWQFCTDATQPSFTASVLRCIGHHAIGTVPWRVDLVNAALELPSVGIRDAAVQAAETWGDSDFCDVLRTHAETAETRDWLRQYIFAVIDDLT